MKRMRTMILFIDRNLIANNSIWLDLIVEKIYVYLVAFNNLIDAGWLFPFISYDFNQQQLFAIMSSLIFNPFLKEFQNYVVDHNPENLTDDDRGRFGTIYKAYSKSDQRIIAAKFIPKKTLQQCFNYEREIEAMTDLCKQHPNLIKFYGYQNSEKGIYYFMEYYKNGNLACYMRKNVLSELKILAIYKQIVDGMIFINQHRKVHRDLKSQNILIDDDGNARIADFGLSRNISLKMTKQAGTPIYAAPEVIFCQKYDERCDVWSSGIILYEMLAGSAYHLLFKQEKNYYQLNVQHLKEALIKLRNGTYKIKAPETVSEQWTPLLKKILVFERNQRKNFSQVKILLKEFEDKMIDKLNLNQSKAEQSYKVSSIGMDRNNANKCLVQGQRQKSKLMVQKLQRWLTFQKDKWSFMLKINDAIRKPFDKIKNVHKYILVFLCYGEVISRRLEIKKQLQQGELYLPCSKFKEKFLHHDHIQKYIDMRDQALLQLKANIEKEKSFVKKLLENKYFSFPSDYPEICNDTELLTLIERFKEGDFCKVEANKQKYKRIMNSRECYIPNIDLHKLSEESLRTYLTIRLIGDVDNFILDHKYQEQDYAIKRTKEFQKYSLQDLDSLILSYNYAG